MNVTDPRSARGLGWLPDAEDLVQHQLVSRHLSKLTGALSPLFGEAEVDYSLLMPEIPDQGPTSACVGFAFATALFLTAAVAGRPIPRPSEKLIYDFARAEDQPYVKLVDSGSRPLAAIACLVEKGMVAQTEWPLIIRADGSSNADVRPPLDVFQNALGYRVGDYYRIPRGPGAAAQIRHALARGFCPVFAMPVDDEYMWLRDGRIYEGRKGTIRGWHMQAIAGSGDGFKKIVTSWGRGHGDGGVVKISDDYIDSGEPTDIIVATVVPSLAA